MDRIVRNHVDKDIRANNGFFQILGELALEKLEIKTPVYETFAFLRSTCKDNIDKDSK